MNELATADVEEVLASRLEEEAHGDDDEACSQRAWLCPACSPQAVQHPATNGQRGGGASCSRDGPKRLFFLEGVATYFPPMVNMLR